MMAQFLVCVHCPHHRDFHILIAPDGDFEVQCNKCFHSMYKGTTPKELETIWQPPQRKPQ